MPRCEFVIAWIGQCSRQAGPGLTLCRDHAKQRCVECGKQAFRDCEETAELVCGAPLCHQCSHSKHDREVSPRGSE